MSGKKQSASSQFFIAKPWEWEWDKLPPEEIDQRYVAQLATKDQIDSYVQAIMNRVHQLKLEMWSRLETANLQDTQDFNRKLNELDKEYRSALRLRDKAVDVINYIGKRRPHGNSDAGAQELELSERHS
jgi:hypothetical protein